MHDVADEFVVVYTIIYSQYVNHSMRISKYILGMSPKIHSFPFFTFLFITVCKFAILCPWQVRLEVIHHHIAVHKQSFYL